MNIWVQVITATVLFLILQWYFSKKDKDEAGNEYSNVVVVLKLIVKVTFFGAFITSQIAVFPAVYARFEAFGVSGVVLDILATFTSLLAAGTPDVIVNQLWPYWFNMYIERKDKKVKNSNYVPTWKQKRIYGIILALCLTGTVATISLSLVAPALLHGTFTKTKMDVVGTTTDYVNLKQVQIKSLEDELRKAERLKEEDLQKFKDTYPRDSKKAFVDSVPYYVGWANRKLLARDYAKYADQIMEINAAITAAKIASTEESGEISRTVIQDNNSQSETEAVQRTVVTRYLRIFGPGCTGVQIPAIFILALLGVFSNKVVRGKRPDNNVFIIEGDVVIPKKKQAKLPEVEEDESDGFIIQWNMELHQVEYLHTMLSGKNQGQQVWKDLKWVSQQLSTNKNRYNQAAPSDDVSTLQENIRKWEKIKFQMKKIQQQKRT